MDRKLACLLGVIAVILVFVFYNTSSKLNRMYEEVSGQRNTIASLEHKLDQVSGGLNSITQDIQKTLEEQQKRIAWKKHTTAKYNRDTKTADMRISIALKELEKNGKVLLKTEKGTDVSTIPMSHKEGLEYYADIRVGLEDPVRLSAVCDGNMVREELLFKINLRELLENRIWIGSGGWSTSYSPDSGKTEYQRDFEIINNHNGDESLRIRSCRVEWKADNKIVFTETYDSPDNEIFSDEAQDRIKVILGNGSNGYEFDSEKETNLSLHITMEDYLGLAYEYAECEILSAGDGKDQKPDPVSASSGSTGAFSISEDSDNPENSGFHLVQ